MFEKALLIVQIRHDIFPQMEVIDFNVVNGQVVPYEGGKVTLSEYWDGPEGNEACRIVTAANSFLRDRIIEKVREYSNPFDKIDALTQHFLDGYNYDYNVVFGKERQFHEINIGKLRFLSLSVTLREGFIDPDGGHDLNGKKKLQSPTAHVLKLFQCVTGSNEIARILRPNDIKTEMVSAPSFCFNKYEKTLQKIGHVYNTLQLPSGKEVAYDICAHLMERDIEELCKSDSKLKSLDKTLLFDKNNNRAIPFVL